MYYSPLGESLKPGADVEGIKKMMEPYCKPIFSANPEIRQKTIKELVSQEICPAWVLKSTSLLGRCFPFTVSSSNATVVNPEDTLNHHRRLQWPAQDCTHQDVGLPQPA